MEQGTLDELCLTRSVTKHIRKHNKDILCGAVVGSDYSAIRLSEEIAVNAEGISTSPYVAWTKAMNNLAVSGGEPVAVRIDMLLPMEVEESHIKMWMHDFNELADKSGIQIAGGHTQVSHIYNEPSFIVNVIGQVREELVFSKKKCAGYHIVMIGYTGLMGTDIIAREKFDELATRYSASYIKGAFFDKEAYGILNHVAQIKNIAEGSDIELLYMHDVSHGGVYGALWQLGARLNHGIRINHLQIPIKQETVEICEFYDINPYMLEGTGALLVVTNKGEELVSELTSKNINASVVGTVTEDKERVVILSEEKRFLAPVKGDEIYKVLSNMCK